MQDTGNIFLDTVDRFRTAENIFQDTVYWFRIAAAQDTARDTARDTAWDTARDTARDTETNKKWKYYCKMKTKYIFLIILQKSTQKWLTIYLFFFLILIFPKYTWELKLFPAPPLLKMNIFYKKKRAQLHEAKTKMVNHPERNVSFLLSDWHNIGYNLLCLMYIGLKHMPVN